MIARLLTMAAAGLIVAALTACATSVTTVVTVRHAEKQSGVRDPGLTPEGQRRAEALRDHLRGAGIAAVYSTDTRRTRATAQPLATYLGVPVGLYRTPAEIAEKIRADHQGQAVLVVAHSNTLGLVVDALGADRPAGLPRPIGERDYDNLVTIVIEEDGVAQAVHSLYGELSP